MEWHLRCQLKQATVSRNRYIVVVEDDHGIRDVLRHTLELEGYIVKTASNGREGLSLVSSLSESAITSPCLIILDLMMPIMNGWEFLEAIKTNESLSKIPIVVISAFSNNTQNISVHTKIKKPFQLDYLFKVVKQFCR